MQKPGTAGRKVRSGAPGKFYQSRLGGKRGKAVARLVPMPDTPNLFGAMSGSVMKAGDIVSPLKNAWDGAGLGSRRNMGLKFTV